MNAVPIPTGPRPDDGLTPDQRYKKRTIFPCREQLGGPEYRLSGACVNPGGIAVGVAVAAISEMIAAAPHMDFSVAMARAMLDDVVREERELAARCRKRHEGGT